MYYNLLKYKNSFHCISDDGISLNWPCQYFWETISSLLSSIEIDTRRHHILTGHSGPTKQIVVEMLMLAKH